MAEVKVGQVYVSARSKSGRRWEVSRESWCLSWRLEPLIGKWGRRPEPQTGGGVRDLIVPDEFLTDPKRWRLVEEAPGA